MTQELVPFDYNSLPNEVQSEAQQISARVKQRIQSHNKQTVENVMAIGQELIAIKPKLDHGDFLKWCELEFDLSRQQVNNFIHVVELAEKNEMSDYLTFKPTVLYELAAPSCPQGVRQLAVKKGGENVTVQNVKDWKHSIAAKQTPNKTKKTTKTKSPPPKKGKRFHQSVAKKTYNFLYHAKEDFAGLEPDVVKKDENLLAKFKETATALEDAAKAINLLIL